MKNPPIHNEGLKNIMINGLNEWSVYKGCSVIIIVFYENNQNQRVKLLSKNTPIHNEGLKNLMINGLNEWSVYKGCCVGIQK